jgi:transcriptional antiterminator RfaH
LIFDEGESMSDSELGCLSESVYDVSAHLPEDDLLEMQNSIQAADETVTSDVSSWYLVHTKPRQEVVALNNLVRQGYHCYLPTLHVEKIRRRKIEVVVEPLFQRYLFIRLNDSGSGKSWSPIRSTVGVSQLVRFGNTTSKVSDDLVQLLHDRESGKCVQKLFQHGDAVEIMEGAFAGVSAIFQTQDAERRSIILLDILGRSTQLKVDAAALRMCA